MREIKYILSDTKGHPLGDTNMYINEMCYICEMDLRDGTKVLRSRDNRIICEECAYNIHSAYEANL